jgi:hypothetical protein
MPHISLAYPFLPVVEFRAVEEGLRIVCRDLPAFEVELAEFRSHP